MQFGGFLSATALGLFVAGFAGTATAQPVVGQPASALVFPYFDSTPSHGTLITVTNTNTSRVSCGNTFRQGDIDVHYIYFGFDTGRGFCREFNNDHSLTPGDTITVFADQDDPEGEIGWLWVEARDPESGDAVDFDYLIGSAIVVNTGTDFLFHYLPYGFRSHADEAKTLTTTDGCGRTLTDLDGGLDADFDGVEYDFWPQRLLLDQFFQQGGSNPTFANSLTLASCDVDPFDNDFGTSVSIHPWNNRERRFSAFLNFECFFHDALAPAVSNVFLNLLGDNDELVLGSRHIQTGWIEFDANDAIVGVFHQSISGTFFAAGHQLEFEGAFGGPDDPNLSHTPCSLIR
ncbi:MAG: hypothetical protein HYR85_03815 [Planctomycetes bacterium]|nr:hypothetical protein [Planctomycetota bacterium]MBI3848501.1 hypothetical protein [Planctomycetota bacterium]